MRPSDVIAGRANSQHGLRWLAFASLATGCAGEVASDSATNAREAWATKAWPALGGCVGCHGKQPAIDFLAPGTSDGAYETVFEYQPPILDVAAPASSLLLTMGKHTGPALDAQAAAQLMTWLDAERDDRMPETAARVRVGPFKPEVGIATTLELPVAGATMTIVAETGEQGLYLTRFAITASTPLHAVHPLFVSRPPAPVLDEIDRFSELDLRLAANETVELGPVWFLAFDPNDYVSVYFQILEAP